MTRKKPPGVSWESFVEQQIVEAYGAGDFDNLPGFGRPIAELDRDDEEHWWLKDLLRREQLSILPASLEILRVVERELQRIATLMYEADVRRAVAALNEQISKASFAITSGPPSTIGPLDADEIVRKWRQAGQ
jgi:hypothetical protein